MYGSDKAAILMRRSILDSEDSQTTSPEGGKNPLRRRDIRRIESALFETIGRVMGTQPFIASFAIDWQTKGGQPFRRILRVNVNYRTEVTRDSGETLQDGETRKTQRQTIDDIFDLVAAIKMAQSQSWLNVPADRLLASVPDTLGYASGTIRMKASGKAMFMVILSTQNKNVNSQILSGVKDYLADSGIFQEPIEFECE